MSTENNIVTFFNKRYPNGRYSETAPAYFNVEKDRYDRFSLDIGWAMRSMHSNRRMRGMAGGNCRRYKKTCNGFIVCKDENCSFFMFQRRPGITEAAVKNQINAGCPGCSGTMYHNRTCRAHAFFYFEGNVCTLVHYGEHNHNQMDNGDDHQENPPHYLDKHLSNKQQQKLDQYLDNYKQHDDKPQGYERAPLPQRKAKGLVSGILDKEGTIAKSVRSINPVLGNLDRVNYEIRKRGKNTKEKSTDGKDIFNKFEELENEYPDYITSANITSHSFIITFRAPLMPKYVNFNAFPCITDVTYKAFPKDRYMCPTVLYFPEIRKHALIFQAVIGGLKKEHFHEYFLALFSLYKIDFSSSDNFIGMVMDFSLSQKDGYLSAYTTYTCGMTDGLKYLKGCYMHWMQSVQRISSIHAVVPVDKRTAFLELTVKLRTTVDDMEFNDTCNNIVSEFPDARKWLIWWLQPDVRSMICVNGSIMKRSLRFHVCRTSNAIESFHRVFNTLIKGGQPLGSTLRRALKLAKSDQDDLSQFYEYGMLTTYNRQQKLRKPRRIGTKSYAENDGRAPDNTDAIFADENELRKQERVKQKSTPKQLHVDDSKVSDQRAYLTENDIKDIMCCDSKGFVLMNENELAALEVNDPTIQEELYRIEEIEDYDISVLMQSDKLQETSSREASLQPQSPSEYIDIDDDGCFDYGTNPNSMSGNITPSVIENASNIENTTYHLSSA